MGQLIPIKITKGVFYFYADEILPYIPEELKIKALKRGKGIIRCDRCEQRQRKE